MAGPSQAFAATLAAQTRSALTLLRIVLELYAGTCNLSHAAMRAGCFVISFGIGFGPAYVLCSKRVQDLISGWVKAGRVKYLLAGILCQSWSRARMQPAADAPRLGELYGFASLEIRERKVENNEW